MDWDSGIDRIARALGRIPWEVWHVDRAKLLERPAFKDIGDTSDRYPPSAFITLMAMAGLNDYQTEDKAEIGYWPPLWKQVTSKNVPHDISELEGILRPLYGEMITYRGKDAREKERQRKIHVKRLQTFLKANSSLAQELWSMQPDQVAVDLPKLWRRFATTMDQGPYAKTIAYAPKTIGNALHILGLDSFDYTGIPIPSDYRLGNLTPQLKQSRFTNDTPSKIQEFWADVLSIMQQLEGRISTYHLDNFLWPYEGAHDKLSWLEESPGIDEALSRQIVDAFKAIEEVRPR